MKFDPSFEERKIITKGKKQHEYTKEAKDAKGNALILKRELGMRDMINIMYDPKVRRTCFDYDLKFDELEEIKLVKEMTRSLDIAIRFKSDLSQAVKSGGLRDFRIEDW